VLRITPRRNPEINDYWMPDVHRLNVGIYNDNRVSGVKLRGDIPIDFEEGLKKAAQLVDTHRKEIFFLGSAYASLESNYALRRMANQLGVDKLYYVPHVEPGFGDGWLIQDDRTPNAASCELLGFEAIELEALKTKLASGEIKCLYALENDRSFAELGEELQGVTVIAHATQYRPVFETIDILLPAATSIEGEGTYINQKNIPQVSALAKQIRQMSPEMWMRLPKSRLDKGAVAVDRWRNLDNIFDVLPSWQLLSRIGAHLGLELPYEAHPDIFKALQAEFDLLKDIKVSYKPPKESFKFTQLEYAPEWGAR
jgi:NADH-quinone oxidoreductase subunit G